MKTTRPSDDNGLAEADRPASNATTPNLALISASLAGAVALAACGGGSEPPAPAPAPAPPVAALTPQEASRFLAQASFGANRAEVDRMRGLGVASWLDAQFALPLGPGHVEWLRAQGFEASAFVNSRAPIDYSLWRKFLSSPDQLRQRTVYALTQIMVIAVEGVGGRWPAFAAAHYLDLLETHAFGNFRNLLEAVTLSPAMGNYLSMRGSRKADTAGRQPDENYAREVMQLFTIGLVELNGDGTPRTQSGVPVDSYGQADVAGLARVFTGWDYASSAIDTAASVTTPMVATASRHESGSKVFLGNTIAANTSASDSLRLALDTLFNHANVGPFIARQLIQRMVASNPSPAYVGRVAAVFANDGTGVRGNLKAVLRALLLDTEARDMVAARASAGTGKLREPVLRFTQWARAASVASASGQWRLGNLSDPATRLGQSPLHSPSVFNFYRPGYVPPNTALAMAAEVAPEFQITTESSVAGYLNFMQSAIGITSTTTNGVTGSDLRPDYTAWLALAAPGAGKLREPVLRFTQWARASAVASPSGQWRLGNLSDPATRLGQSPLHSPSVFNFYRPGYVPPNTALATAAEVAPEFQITTESSVAGYLNFMQAAIGITSTTTNGVTGSDLRPDYTAWLALAPDAAALADEANLVLASGQLVAARVTLVRDALAAMPAATATDQLRRVQAALLLTLAAPDYLALK